MCDECRGRCGWCRRQGDLSQPRRTAKEARTDSHDSAPQELDTKLSKADKAASAAREAAVKKQSGEFEKHVKKAIEGATLAAKKHSEKAVASSAASLREDLKTIQKKSSSDIKEALTKSETAQARARDEQINAALEKIRGEMKSESARSDQKIKEIGENLGAISSAGNAGSIDAKALLKREKALVTEMRADLDKGNRAAQN